MDKDLLSWIQITDFRNKLTGKVFVWQVGDADFPATITPKIHNNLPASVGVRTKKYFDLNASLSIVGRVDSDLPASITPRLMSDLPAKLFVSYHGKMTGKVLIYAPADSDLEASISPRIHSELPSSIGSRVKAFHDFPASISSAKYSTEELPGSIEPKLLNDLPAKINVAPHNRMTGIVEIVDPPCKVENLAPIKDAFVRSAVPKLDYGTEDMMVIGRGAEEFRSLLQFTQFNLPANHEILRATLKLTHAIDCPAEQEFGLYEADTAWAEYGVTWDNQPPTGNLITTFKSGIGKTTINIDVTNILTDWGKGAKFNRGFIIKPLNDGGKVYYYSRESANPPQLIVEHYDITSTFSIGMTSLPASIAPRVPGHSDLAGSINVKSYNTYSQIPGSITVPEYRGTSEITASIDTRMRSGVNIPGTVAVRREGLRDFPSWIDVVRTFDIPASMTVSRPLLKSSITVKQFGNGDLPARVVVRYHEDLPAYISARRSTLKDLPARISVRRSSQVEIPAELTIHKTANLPATISVKRAAQKDIPAKIGVVHPGKSELGGSLYVRSSINVVTLPASINIRANGKKDLPAKVEVKYNGSAEIPADVLVPWRDDLLANISARREKSKDMSGSLSVRRKDSSEITGELLIPWADYLPSEITVQRYGKKEIGAAVTVRRYGSDEIPASITYKEVNDLPASIGVVYVNRHDLPATLTPRVKYASDLKSWIQVGGGAAYAFIM